MPLEVLTKEDFYELAKPLLDRIEALEYKVSVYEKRPLRMFLRPTEVIQQVVGVHEATLKDWAKAGLIIRKKVGATVMYERDSLLNFLYSESCSPEHRAKAKVPLPSFTKELDDQYIKRKYFEWEEQYKNHFKP